MVGRWSADHLFTVQLVHDYPPIAPLKEEEACTRARTRTHTHTHTHTHTQRGGGERGVRRGGGKEREGGREGNITKFTERKNSMGATNSCSFLVLGVFCCFYFQVFGCCP